MGLYFDLSSALKQRKVEGSCGHAKNIHNCLQSVNNYNLQVHCSVSMAMLDPSTQNGKYDLIT